MDYLDTFVVDSSNKKRHRVRSWYLYEQYKSLENNQLDAAKILNSKSYQNHILRQELKERRARRRLCDQYELSQSESKLDRSIQNCPSASTDDLYESLCELHEDLKVEELKESCSCEGSQNNDDFNGIEYQKDSFSDSESIQSVIDNVTFLGNLGDNVKQELEIVKKNIAKNINLQLQTVKDIECLEKSSKQDDLLRENSEREYLKDTEKIENNTKNIFESLFSMWSSLVVFAYNSIQLNHGNCYCQCSSQLLTAVLACDFLRRGVDSMCHILQSYVSPIKYATSDSESSVITPVTRNCQCKRKNIANYKKPYIITGTSKVMLIQPYFSMKHCSCNRPNYKSKTFDKRCYSENKYNSIYSSDNRFNEEICRGTSEPWRSSKFINKKKKTSGKYSRSAHNLLKGKFSNKSLCNCHYLKDIVNPILKVATYIENILQEVEETPVWI